MQNQRKHGKNIGFNESWCFGQTIMAFLFVDSYGAVQKSALSGPRPSSVLSNSIISDLPLDGLLSEAQSAY